MPLAFLISIFCRPLSANGATALSSHEFHGTFGIARIFARKMYISGRRAESCRVLRFHHRFYHPFPRPSQQELFGAETWRVACNYNKHAVGIAIGYLTRRYFGPRSNTLYFYADNKIQRGFCAQKYNYPICDTALPSHVCIFSLSVTTLSCVTFTFGILEFTVNKYIIHVQNNK